MSSANSDNCIRKSEEIAAYLDGELDGPAQAEVEQHLRECASCSHGLREQKLLLCALDLAFKGEPQLRLPSNFSRIVAAQAQSDMSGLRHRSERRRALRLCAALAAASVALLGGAALSETVLRPVIAACRQVASLFELLWQALHGAGRGLTIILRALSRHFIFDSHPLSAFLLLLFFTALALLPRLIISYHRQRTVSEDGA
ncbi:MAG: zf-HC2 domain-containing protein [Pyrinomonadaceae bacterium]